MSAPGRAEEDRPCAIGPAAVTHGADIGPAPRRVGAGDAATTKGGHALHRIQPPTLGREPAPRSRALETRLADRGVRGIGRRDGQRKRRADDSDDDHDGHEHDGRAAQTEATPKRGAEQRARDRRHKKPGRRNKKADVRARGDREPSQHQKCGGQHERAEGRRRQRPARARWIDRETDRDAARDDHEERPREIERWEHKEHTEERKTEDSRHDERHHTESVAYRLADTPKARDQAMDIGLYGLGRMGGNMVTRLARGGHRVIAGNRSPEPALDTLAPPNGWSHFGKNGAGHFVKMVHNGIEYGMMQAYGEGFELLHASEFELDLRKVSTVWLQGSVVRSWLLELAERAFEQEGSDLKNIKGWVEDSGEGRWTVLEAVTHGVPMTAISHSLFARFVSRQEDSYAMKVAAALRKQFGGDAVKQE